MQLTASGAGAGNGEQGPTMAGVPKLALSVEEAAWAMGISKRKVDELIADRTSGFPVTRIGRRCVVVVEALTKWLADRVGKSAR